LPGFAIVRLAEIVGRPKAKELSILGDPISAEEAYRLGLVLRVVPHEKLMAEAMEFAEKIASKPRLAVQMAKSFYNRGLGGDEMRHAIDGFPLLFMHDDAREGIARFARSESRNSASRDYRCNTDRSRRRRRRSEGGSYRRPWQTIVADVVGRGSPVVLAHGGGQTARRGPEPPRR